MTLNQRIAYVGIQLWACECGEINAIICPYCGEVNAKGYSLCCDQLAQACAAVLARGGSQPEQCTGGKQRSVVMAVDFAELPFGNQQARPNPALDVAASRSTIKVSTDEMFTFCPQRYEGPTKTVQENQSLALQAELGNTGITILRASGAVRYPA
jgi:hypothetical protein